MGSRWRKLKVAFGKNLVAAAAADHESPPPRSTAVPISPPASKLSNSSTSSSSKKTCSICLASMRQGDGHAIFTAECSHSFHFHCIASNVNHGNQICPICRAKWNEIPLQGPNPDSPRGQPLVHPLMPAIRNGPPLSHPTEPAVFNDDESLDHLASSTETSFSSNKSPSDFKVDIKTYTEFPSVPKSSSVKSFIVLIHLKAPLSSSFHNTSQDNSEFPRISPFPRASIDLVTILDISGSMAGSKLALLKRAMGFLIQNLGPNDRLSVVSFSSMARRLFPLRRMTDSGRQQALQSVNSLIASGGTNIAEGLKKGAQIMGDRREKNPVSSIILLSDGQDTYTVNSCQNPLRYDMLLPSSKIPIHTFGFGKDHDASSTHSISEISGGTFSFIEDEGVIQDAFAQCIGGLLSVCVKDLHVLIECVGPNVHLSSLKSGSYPSSIMHDQRMGSISVGDLYADEERDFLLCLNVPTEVSCETLLLKVKCVYNDLLTKEQMTSEHKQVRIQRTDFIRTEDASLEVDRQKNRIRAAEAMGKARAVAEKGDLGGAVSVIEDVRKVLSESVSGRAKDRLCIALDAELKEMQERMLNRRVYEDYGRAYILSGMSSHSWQRATARGDSVESLSVVHGYQTPSMAEMVTRSQASFLGRNSGQRVVRPQARLR